MHAVRPDHAQYSDGGRADLSRDTDEIAHELLRLTVVNLTTEKRFERHRLIRWLRRRS